MGYAKPHRWMDVEVRQGLSGDPACYAGLGTGAQFPANRLCMEAERELLAYLAVVVGDDVPGVRVDPAQAGDLDVDAGFLADLALGGFDHRLAEVLSAAGQCPQAVVGPLDQQQLALRVPDGCGDGDDDVVGLRS